MTINFNTEPYNDDYDIKKDFYRILFRPGYAVQARELTQLQSILQNQTTQFGDHVFKNGSQVIPGSINVDAHFHFIKLETVYNGENIFAYIEQFRDKIITGGTSGVKLRVVDTSLCDCVTTNLDIATLYCKIEDTASDGVTKRLVAGEEVIAYEADNQIATNFLLTDDQDGNIVAKIKSLGDQGEAATTYYEGSGNESSNVVGRAYGVDVKEGVYYIDGFFVRNPELHLYVGRFTRFPTARVGFKVTEETLTPEQDSTLLDNATGTPNFAAPGAHRYKISLSLVDQPYGSTDTFRFVELIRIENGTIQSKVEKASYSELEKTLARRTFDESGNYEVNKFKLGLREHYNDGANLGLYNPEPVNPIQGVTYGDPRKFVTTIEPGKAYIQGYEVESVATQYITFDKAREQLDENDNVIENGHIVRVDDAPIGTPVGNYALVEDLYERPDITGFGRVFLVAKLNSSPGAAPSATDIIGTARVRGLELHDGDYNKPDTFDVKFKLSLFDVKMYAGYSFEKNVKSISSTQTGSDNFTCNIVPEINNLVGSISCATSDPTVTGVGTDFSLSLVVGDVIYSDGVRIGTVSSITDNLELELDANASANVVGGRISVGRSRIYDNDYEDLIFPTGYSYVKTLRGWDGSADTVKSTVITVRQSATVVSDSSGTVEVEVTGNQILASDSDLRNYTLINNSTNKVVDIDSGDIRFNDNTNRTNVFIDNQSSNTSYTLYYSVTQSGSAGAEREKQLQQNHTHTITGKKSVVGKIIELDNADALRLVKVEMTPGNFTAFNANSAVDITSRYDLDDGQRSTHYTNAKLILKPGQQPPTGAVKVTYDYFEYGTTGNYFSVDSYATIPYDDIPVYSVYDASTKTKKELSLSTVIDFRPVIAGDNSFSPSLPKIGTDANSSIAYYIGRQDKLIVDSIGRFNVLQGVPALDPQEPEDPNEGLVLATFFIPPYTRNVSDVKVRQRDNRRYTMKDIGKIERRITNLEYAVALNMLEKEAETLNIKDTNGLDKFKNGFIVDQFTGHGIGNVKDGDYKIAVDRVKKELRPMHFTTALEVVEDLDSGLDRSSKDYQKTSDLITLPYTQSMFVENPYASRAIDVNPYKIGAFKGEITLLPEGDNWKDTDRRPDLNVTDDNNFDAIKFIADQTGVTGTDWNEWVTTWTGSSSTSANWATGNQWGGTDTYNTTVTTDTGFNSRTGILTNLTSSVNSQDYGDRVVDLSYAHFMRSRPVAFVARNLKRSTRFYPFFDDVSVADYCKPADKFVVTRATGSPVMDFSAAAMDQNVLADDPHRAYWGSAEPAFQYGDVITNDTHTAVDITAIASCNGIATDSIDITVSSSAGIDAGHQVWLYNMGRSYYNFGGNSLHNNIPPISAAEKNNGIVDTSKTARQLDWRLFKVTGVTGNVVTVAPIAYKMVADADPTFAKHRTDKTSYIPYAMVYDDYVPASGYSGSNRGKLVRLQASAVVTYDGYVSDSDNSGNVTQEIFVTNVRHGFAVGDNLTGTCQIGSSSNLNQVTLDSVNGHTDEDTAPPMFVVGDQNTADIDGTVVGTFNLPQTPTLAFRTGERKFTITDNISNSDADFDSKGSINYYSQGVTLAKERTIVNTRTANFTQDRLYEQYDVRRTTTNTRLIARTFPPPPPQQNGGGGHDPLAQTFTVASHGGAFVTSVDLFFSEAGNRPVILEIRTTNFGVPGTKIVPFSQVTKTPQEINVSDDGTVATTFTFPAPVYLQDQETYALVVKTDEPGCQAFISELAQPDLATSNLITIQPLTGSLFLSQNSKEFEINPLLDLKFTLRKAVFDTSQAVNVDLRANSPAEFVLPVHPFEITPNTYKIRVSAPNHGFIANDIVKIDDVEEGLYGTNSTTTGIPDELFNRPHTVLGEGLEKDSFIIELDYTDGDGNSLLEGGITSANFLKGSYGGSGVSCSRSLHLDSIYLKTSDLNFQDTNLKYYVNAQNAAGNYTDYLPMVSNANYPFFTRKHIKSFENQSIVSGIHQSSMKFRAVMTSENSNVSPVIDMQKISAYSTSNLVNSRTAADTNVAEIDSLILIQGGDIIESDRVTAGAGTITVSGTAVTGSTTAFTVQVRAGDVLRLLDDTVIGTVDTVNSNTSITLTSSATSQTGVSYEIVGADTNLVFENDSETGWGVISTNLDAADNLLDNANIGKTITITDAHANVNGTYVVKDVVTTADTSVYAGNVNLSKVSVYVEPQFAGNATIDMVTDNDYAITQLDRFVDDFAPIGATNAANYITRTMTLATAADSLKILFDANIPSNADVKVYFRTWDGEQDLRVVPYVDSGFTVTSFDSSNQFIEREIGIEDLPPFTNVNIKIVLKSTDGAVVPRLKNLRMIAVS